MTLANINCRVPSCARGAAWPRGQLSTIRIRVPNRDSIRSNTNSACGPLFGPVRIRIEYSVQAYSGVNSGVKSSFNSFLQCFDTVGWAI